MTNERSPVPTPRAKATEPDGSGAPAEVSLHPVDSGSWRALLRLEVHPDQAEFVAHPGYYLALCAYGGSGWRPLAIRADDVPERPVGFMMWGYDPDDESVWLGGILIDRAHQRRGYGAAAVRAAVAAYAERSPRRRVALSYRPDNAVARRLYARLGFVETGAREGDEVVAALVAPEPGGAGG